VLGWCKVLMDSQPKQKEKLLFDIKNLCWQFVNRYMFSSNTYRLYHDDNNGLYIYYNYNKKIYIYIGKLFFAFNLSGDLLEIAFDGKILVSDKALGQQERPDYFDIETIIPDDILFDYYAKIKTAIIHAI
jgi:hypothetical protein